MGRSAKQGAMGCEAYEPFIDAYIDEEFGERERADMEAHLAHCEACRGQVEVQVRFRAQVRQHLVLEKAPESFRARLFHELESLEREVEGGEEEAEAPAEVVEAKVGWRLPSMSRVGWVMGPLAAMATLVVVLQGFTIAPAASSPTTMIDDTLDWHRGDFPLEVTTADPQEAQAWFAGKVDFSVRLPQFVDRRVNLLGGRIAHIEDRRAALLLYEVDGSKLSVVLFDGEGLTVPRETLRQVKGRDIVWLNQRGYGVALLQDSGVTYAMTSDLSEDRLLDLVATSIDRR